MFLNMLFSRLSCAVLLTVALANYNTLNASASKIIPMELSQSGPSAFKPVKPKLSEHSLETSPLIAPRVVEHPLAKRTLKKTINEFDGYSLPLPEGVQLKAANVHFKVTKTDESFSKARRGRPTRVKKRKLVYRETFFNILQGSDVAGRIVLRETPNNANLDGDFSLHLIEIDEAYKGRSLGNTALDLVILLSQQLAKKSLFYNRMTLQCSDYDADGTHLGNVPFRLSYYLNHGFHVDPKTASYVNHLDTQFFVQQFTPDFFESFLSDYSDGKYETIALDLKSYIPFAVDILAELKRVYGCAGFESPNVGVLNSALAIAESSSSSAGQRIIDRMFYDARLSEESYNRSAGEYIYIMHLDVDNWQQALSDRQNYRAQQRETPVYDPFDLDVLLWKIDDIARNFKLAAVEKENNGNDIGASPKKRQRDHLSERDSLGIMPPSPDHEIDPNPRALKKRFTLDGSVLKII